MKVLIAGGGPSGLLTGYYLSKNGMSITIAEKSGKTGGLLKTVSIDGIEIEAVYHHILFNDDYLLRLISELSLEEKLNWHRSRIALYTHNKYYDISTPFNYLLLDIIDTKKRFSLVRNLAFPDTGAKSLRELFGEDVYRTFIEDMLINKFGEYADRIHPEWFISKLKKRGRSRCVIYERLGYLNGSFRSFCERTEDFIIRQNGKILTNTIIKSIRIKDKGFVVNLNGIACEFDRIVFTISPHDIAELLRDADSEFAQRLMNLDFMSNITMLLYTRKNLTGYYWINIADRNIKLTGIISQSNFVRYKNVKGFFTYISLYLSKKDPMLSENTSRIKDLILSELKKMGIDVSNNDIIDYRITKTEYAQPLYLSSDDLILSQMKTPVEGIYILNNHSILPEDRGLNNIIYKANLLSGLIR